MPPRGRSKAAADDGEDQELKDVGALVPGWSPQQAAPPPSDPPVAGGDEWTPERIEALKAEMAAKRGQPEPPAALTPAPAAPAPAQQPTPAPAVDPGSAQAHELVVTVTITAGGQQVAHGSNAAGLALLGALPASARKSVVKSLAEAAARDAIQGYNATVGSARRGRAGS